MSRRRTKTPGWAAFDPNKQQKQVNTHNDPYPPISTALQHNQNPSRYDDLNGKSFYSVLTHSSHVPARDDTHNPSVDDSQSEKMTSKCIKNIPQLYEKLMVDHPWANENLIEDIVVSVDYNVEKALILLNEMAPHDRLPDKKETKDTKLDDIMEAVDLTAKNDEQLDDHNDYGKLVLDNDVQLGFMMDLSMIPMEPEWEDDDMYLMHRKPAIRAMRLASRHSKAASEAYLKRDHATAQEYSLKAREEWSNAEKLNAKAAKDILAIRNFENDDYKLDLHGLHATEAVQVLLEHLQKIELPGSQSSKSDKNNLKVGLEAEKSDRQQLFKPRLLEVITGKGIHSRGEAALPAAIKSFLSEKGYYYYEARTGVITVQPKFRQPSTAMSITK